MTEWRNQKPQNPKYSSGRVTGYGVCLQDGEKPETLKLPPPWLLEVVVAVALLVRMSRHRSGENYAHTRRASHTSRPPCSAGSRGCTRNTWGLIQPSCYPPSRLGSSWCRGSSTVFPSAHVDWVVQILGHVDWVVQTLGHLVHHFCLRSKAHPPSLRKPPRLCGWHHMPCHAMGKTAVHNPKTRFGSSSSSKGVQE